VGEEAAAHWESKGAGEGGQKGVSGRGEGEGREMEGLELSRPHSLAHACSLFLFLFLFLFLPLFLLLSLSLSLPLPLSLARALSPSLFRKTGTECKFGWTCRPEGPLSFITKSSFYVLTISQPVPALLAEVLHSVSPRFNASTQIRLSSQTDGFLHYVGVALLDYCSLIGKLDSSARRGQGSASHGTFSLSPSSNRAQIARYSNSATSSRRPCHRDRCNTSATRPAPPAVPCRASCLLLSARLVSPMHLPQSCVRARSLAVDPAKTGQKISSCFAHNNLCPVLGIHPPWADPEQAEGRPKRGDRAVGRPWAGARI